MRLSIFLLSLLGLLNYQSSFCQCVADAGPDISVCVGMDSLITEQIGATPVATGGVPPYSYVWETSYTWFVGEFTVHYHASDFLNDTTLANPTIVNPFSDELVFTLTVTDSLGMTCLDSVQVNFCEIYTNLGTFSFEINPGDSVLLGGSNIGSSCPPHDYIWQPSHGLSDTTGLGVWASPDSSIAYYTTVTDSASCVETGAPYYYITVLTTGLGDDVKNDVTTDCYPNPFREKSVIHVQKAPPGKLRFEILDANGRSIWERTTTDDRQVIDRNQLPSSGMYIYRVWHEDEVLGSGQLVAE